MHLRGERRRAVALASLVSLVLYLIAAGISGLTNLPLGQGFARLLGQPVSVQLIFLVPIWAGVWLFAFAQREMIAHDEGAYSALLAVSHTRGMGLPGGILGGLMVIALGAGYVLNVLSPAIVVAGGLAALYIIALALPNAPARRYEFNPPATAHIPSIHDAPQQRALPSGPTPARGRIIDAPRPR
jgi:hypothetical protein